MCPAAGFVLEQISLGGSLPAALSNRSGRTAGRPLVVRRRFRTGAVRELTGKANGHSEMTEGHIIITISAIYLHPDSDLMCLT